MQFEEFAKFAKERRTIRRFKTDPFPDEYVAKILEVARWAPSGANSQPWEFVVIKDREMKNKIEELYNRTEYPSNREWELTRREDLRHSIVQMEPPKIADAPVIIVPIGDVRMAYASVVSNHVMFPSRTIENMTNVTLMIHLAAAALGLGTRWTTITEPTMGPLRALLEIPDIYHIYCIVLVGYPAYEPAPCYRRRLSELVHFGKYDMSKYRSNQKIIEYIARLRKRTRPGFAIEIKK